MTLSHSIDLSLVLRASPLRRDAQRQSSVFLSPLERASTRKGQTRIGHPVLTNMPRAPDRFRTYAIPASRSQLDFRLGRHDLSSDLAAKI